VVIIGEHGSYPAGIVPLSVELREAVNSLQPTLSY